MYKGQSLTPSNVGDECIVAVGQEEHREYHWGRVVSCNKLGQEFYQVEARLTGSFQLGVMRAKGDEYEPTDIYYVYPSNRSTFKLISGLLRARDKAEKESRALKISISILRHQLKAALNKRKN